MSSLALKRRIVVSLLSAMAFIIMYLEFPLPLFPAFLKIDFSEIPGFIGALTFGPIYGVLVELLKNVLHYLIKGSFTGVPVGEFSNFLAGSILIYISTWFFEKRKTIGSLLIGLVAGTLSTSIFMALANYLFIMPAYVWFLGYKMDDMIGMAQAANTHITDLFTFVLYAIAPFNLLKGLIIGIVLIPFFQRLKPQIGQNVQMK